MMKIATIAKWFSFGLFFGFLSYLSARVLALYSRFTR